MNNICKNRSALVPPLQRSRDPSVADQHQSASYTTTATATSKRTETITDDILDVLSSTSTITETPAGYTNSTSGVLAATSSDRFLNATTSVHVDTDFYIADDGTANVSLATSYYNRSLAEQLTSAVSTTYSAGGDIRSKISPTRLEALLEFHKVELFLNTLIKRCSEFQS